MTDFSVVFHLVVEEESIEHLYFLNYDRYFSYVLKKGKTYKIFL